MQRKTPSFLTDMVNSITLIQGFVDGRTLNHMATEPMFRSAIYYQFAILGEALSQLRMIDTVTVDRITNAPAIIGFRNRILHGYGVIEDDVTWVIIERDLPLLKKELTLLLSEA